MENAYSGQKNPKCIAAIQHSCELIGRQVILMIGICETAGQNKGIKHY